MIAITFWNIAPSSTSTMQPQDAIHKATLLCCWLSDPSFLWWQQGSQFFPLLMSLLPKEFLPLILTFAPLFSKPVWESAIVLLVGAILTPGKRTVRSILRVMGLHHEPHLQNYHRVLSRAV